MELKHLNTFLALSKIKNFTKCADYLGYVQSNVTTQIQKLEEELGVRLFERINKNISLTLEGERLVPYAQKMIDLSMEITDMYLDSKTCGKLRIGVSESIGIYILPEIIKSYKMMYPLVDIHIEVLDSSEMISMLSNHTIDIALTLDKNINDSSIIIESKRNETISLFAIKDYKITSKKQITAQDLCNIPLILTGKGCCYRGEFERNMLQHSITPKIVLETSSVQVIKETTLSGLGVCLLPEFTVKEEIENKQLIKLPYLFDCQISTQLIYHKDKWVSLIMKEFIKHIKQYI